ncbi:glutamic acid-rich protein-like isoform X5 [Schistocerca nitens]|uniref:glutamic acid-rich protein-like isoform X5 n=1 Tax=Schistocerca nitens TaxID=7011 RepID=UPI00211927AE|nr:glutamic acid-rich protein-like isoform X5 [Schistocerca nitens]
MMTTPARHESFFCDTTFIKQEPVEAEPHTSPKQEIEYISVKEEALVEAEPHTSPKQEIEYISVKEETLCLRDWEVPEGHDSVRDPLSVNKKENSPSEDFRTSSTLNIEKTEDEEEEEKAMSKDSGEECSSSEEFLERSVFHAEKTEDEEGDQAVSEDDFEELKHGVESTSSDSEPESTITVGVEDDKSSDDNGCLASSSSLAAETGNTTKQETSSGNKNVLSQLPWRMTRVKIPVAV